MNSQTAASYFLREKGGWAHHFMSLQDGRRGTCHRVVMHVARSPNMGVERNGIIQVAAVGGLRPIALTPLPHYPVLHL
jgi:hypothetical protein